MLSSVAGPALVPILMPGGIGCMAADAPRADESSAAPPNASFARSRRAGCGVPSFDFDSGVLMSGSPRAFPSSEFHSNIGLYVGLRRAEVREIAHRAREPAERAGIVQIVRRARRRKVGPLPGQVVTVEPDAQLRAFLEYPTLGDEELHPIKARGLQRSRAQRPDRVRIRVGKSAHVKIGRLRSGRE